MRDDLVVVFRVVGAELLELCVAHVEHVLALPEEPARLVELRLEVRDLPLGRGRVNAFESRRSGLRWALGSMANAWPGFDAAFGEVWRNISEMLRVGRVGKLCKNLSESNSRKREF